MTKRPIQAVIFDMDGVIVDSEPRHERAFLEVIRLIGYEGKHQLRFADYVGRSDKELWVDFLAQYTPPYTLEQLLEMKSSRVVEILRREKPLFSGLPELVAKLAERYPLALASGSERLVVDEVLRLDGLARFFKATVSASDIERGKPEPDVFLRAAALLGVDPRACWAIEDSKPGVAAALAAGMKVLAITNTHLPAELAHATCVVESYEEAAQVLLPDPAAA